jgi:hypothetical protein
MRNSVRRSFATILLVGTFAGCGHESVTRAPSAAGAPATPGSPTSTPAAVSDAPPEMAPAPYTTEQLRDANRPGTLYRYKLEMAGEPAQIKVMEFTSGTSAEIAELKSVTFDEAGKTKSPPEVERTPWEKIRRHGEFPRAGLKVEPGSIEVPAGKFDAMVYTVSAPNGETAKFYFAKSYAGPPVLVSKERAGARLMTMTLIERKFAAP